MSEESSELKEIIEQLRQLQVSQTVLLVRLERLEGGETANIPRAPTNRQFIVGDSVRIVNPRIGQSNVGTISRIGPKRITVVDARGRSIVRDPKNLRLLQDS